MMKNQTMLISFHQHLYYNYIIIKQFLPVFFIYLFLFIISSLLRYWRFSRSRSIFLDNKVDIEHKNDSNNTPLLQTAHFNSNKSMLMQPLER